nr:uncharacterized protein LOC112940172 [Solanum lycopersicum]
MFKDTIFGPFLDISKCNFQGQITKCLLLLELEQSNPNMLHIRHSNGCVLKFGIDDFALLTGLKVRGNTNDFKYPEQTNCMLFKKYFPGAVNSVTKHQLVQRFKMGNWESNQDALQMSILFFIHTFVLASIDNTAISIVDFLMVEDGRYQHFPWGQLSFSKLIGSLRQDFDVSKKLYRLYGMPYALNVWIYECASNLNSEIAVRERNVIPRICNWRVVSEKAKFEMLMSTIFQKNACSNIVPTAEEIEAFDIAQVEHAHSTSIPLVQPNEQDDLDDFSTKPPEQLLRTYSRVSDTSPPPPSKRIKKSIIQKKKVSEQKQPDQSNVSPTPDDDVHVSMSSLPQHSNADDVHGSVPQVSPKSAADVHGSVPGVSQNPAADVHGYADSQNVNNIIPHIEELKGYLKTYVSKLFCNF